MREPVPALVREPVRERALEPVRGLDRGRQWERRQARPKARRRNLKEKGRCAAHLASVASSLPVGVAVPETEKVRGREG